MDARNNPIKVNSLLTLIVSSCVWGGLSLSAVALPLSSPYAESEGFVAGEAEHYHQQLSRLGATWVEVSAGNGEGGSFINAQGAAFLQSQPSAAHAPVTYDQSAAVDYTVNIQTPGEYRLWLRWTGYNTSSDSIHAALLEMADGVGGAAADWYVDTSHIDLNFANSGWDGSGQAEASVATASQDPMLWNITTPGKYTLRITPRESGVACDAWILQLNSLPDPTVPPLFANPDGLTMHHGGKALVPVLDNDFNLDNLSAVEVVNLPRSGTAQTVNGGILYAHTTGSPAQDMFSYRLRDASNNVSNTVQVTIDFSNGRIANATLNLPTTPPVTTYSVENAFPGLSFSSPLGIASPPDETQRLFVIEKGGAIRVIHDVTTASPNASLFLNLAALVNARANESFLSGGEQGLLGLAFHPHYSSNGFFYVFYSVNINDQRHQRVSRFQVSGDPLVANSASEQVFIEQFDEASNHNGGDLHFGPDGYLYIAVGDEGGGNDNLNNSQRIDKDYFAGILRIDVDKLAGNIEPNAHPAVIIDGMGNAYYSVPEDNPWVGATTFNGSTVSPASIITEFYAVGLRNPWRFSFDPQTHELWCADVGQNQWEEINIVVHGGNYGWSFFEGTQNGPDTPPNGFVGEDPIYEYPHGSGPFQGNSVTGGVVYRGTNYSNLIGAYIFADFNSGNIWALTRSEGNVEVERIAGSSGIAGLGRDPNNGDVLLCNLFNGQIQRLVGNSSNDNFPATLSQTGIFADLTDLSPNPGIIHYEPILSFWSDYAIKERWFSIPNTTDTIDFAIESPWAFPTGMVWVKHFDIELERGNPSTTKRLETRVLIKTDESAFGVSYRWNESGTEAFLVPDQGATFDLDIIDAGLQKVQTWLIPSRAECMTCHLPQAGHALSFNTRQLNQSASIAGTVGNQIERLGAMGYFSNPPAQAVGLPRHIAMNETDYSLEGRVRSYLAVNCTYCHQSGGSAPDSWDGLPALTLTQTGLVNGEAINNGGDGNQKLVVPGDVTRSVLFHRLEASNNFTRMPPLATNELDHSAIALIRDWIEQELPDYQSYDEWRLEHFGNTTSLAGEPTANPDYDFNNNRLEFLARTNPQDPEDYWNASLINQPNGQLELLFESIKNRGIWIETSKDLSHWQLWQDSTNQGLPAATNAMKAIPLNPEGKANFYRLRIEEK